MIISAISSRRVFFSCFLLLALGVSASFAHAEHRDVAPLPDDVVQKLLQKVAPQHDQTIERLRRHLDETSTLLKQTEAEEIPLQEAGSSFALRAERRSLIAAKLNELASVREEARTRFSEIRQKLLDLNLPDKVKEWDALKAKVEERFNRVNSAMEELRASKDHTGKKKSLAKAKALLSELHEKVIEREMAPDSLPTPTFRQGVPVAPISQPESDQVPQYISQNRAPASNVYAFLGNTLLAQPATPAEATSCNYTAARLSR